MWVKKDELIALRTQKVFEKIKDKTFVDVEQDETFYVVPNLEEVTA